MARNRAVADDRAERNGTGLKRAKTSRNLLMALDGCSKTMRGMVRGEESWITSSIRIP